MTKNTAPICEVFSSLQGEGQHIGWPSIFVRFWGCNLRCRFDGTECDTPYAVYKEFDKAVTKTPQDVMKEIINNHNATNIVFTGGEPLMYQEFIIELMELLIEKDNNYTAEIETNGTIPLEGRTITHYINLFTISQKLKVSNQPENYEKKRINHNALKTFPQHKSYFKFVIRNKEDLKEIREFKQKYPHMLVYLMPEGRTQEELQKTMKKVAEICIKENYYYSPREHIQIWNNKRGV
jgi:organic radical activating enzyme